MSYPTFSLDQLDKTAEQHTDVDILEMGNGAALFTEAGARLLGLFPHADLPNTLWTSEQLGSFLARREWLIGGERLWIAPERHFFYENPRDFEGFHVPAGIDPGNYERLAHCTYENTFSLIDLHSNTPWDNSRMLRSFTPLADPYHTGLAYMGVAANDTVEINGPGAHFCAWSLTQVYSCGPGKAGTAFFPVADTAQLISYFEPVPPRYATVHKEGYASFRIDANAIYKIGIRPEDMRFDNLCKALYLSPFPGSKKWFCLIKRSDSMPRSQAECVDIARSNPEGPMGAIQSYNNGPDFRPDIECPFGEIELQLQKGRDEGGKSVSKAHHELLSYAGTKAQMLDLAQTVLGLQAPPSAY